MRSGVGLLLATVLLIPAGTSAQSAATVPILDEAYPALERLEAFGLVPRGASGLGPYSRGRVAWMARDARAWLDARGDLGPAIRRDLTALLDGLDARFAPESPRRVAGWAETEVGGGSSPGVDFPDNVLGQVHAVRNPLWAGRGGRAYPDAGGLALAARGEAYLSPRLALVAAARSSAGSYDGLESGRRGTVLEALHARAILGRFALQVGRDGVWIRQGGYDGALLGTNGPPLDLVRVATERPLALHVVGDLDVSLFIADLGPGESFPHAKLFGVLLHARPVPSLGIGLTLLNKQMGQGAPAAPFAERIKDLTWAWDWFRDDEGEFSDKSMALSVGYRGAAAALFAEASFTDVDTSRPKHTFRSAAAYRLGVTLPRLGRSGRHTLGLDAAYAGPLIYRHHQFQTGAAVDGFLQGGLAGPDSRAATLRYGYDAPSAGWRMGLRFTAERLLGDAWRLLESDLDELVLVREVPDDVRMRAEGSAVRLLAAGRAGVEVRAGMERAQNPGHADGARAWNRAALVRFWWGF